MMEYQIEEFNGSSYSIGKLTFTGKSISRLQYESNSINVEAEDEYPFFALIKIRLELENHGIKLLCNGSRVDVHPSGMSLTSIFAYELELGKQARKMVNIFEPTDLNKIATVSEQEIYWNKWLKDFS